LYLYANNVIYRKKLTSDVFTSLCLFAIGHLVFDIATVYTVNHLKTVPDYVNLICHILFYLFGALFSSEFFRYVLTLLNLNFLKKISKSQIYAVYALFSVVYFMAFLFIPIKYTIGNGTNYSDGPAAITAFSIPLAFFIATTAILIVKRNSIDKRILVALLPMILVLFIVEIAEIIWTEILIFGACATLATVGVYFSLENPLLFRALQQAKDSEKAMKYFLATMSHEIRTPLNAVIGFTEILKDENLSAEERQSYLNDISTAGHTLLALINDVLDLSKLEVKQMVFTNADTDFQALVHEIIIIFHPQMNEKKLDCIESISKMPTLQIDPLRIRQILFNLLGNAIKFTKSGFIKVSADFTEDADNPGTGALSFSVADSGCGIPPDDMKRVFQPFAQSNNLRGTRVANSGTGLGLAIIQRLIEQLGGNITLESIMGKGSTFTVRLDKVHFKKEGQTAVILQEAMADTDETSSLSGQILTIDDVQTNLKVMKALCEKHGVTCCVAHSFNEAFEILQQKHFDGIFTDLWMPDMNGIQLATKIHADKRFASIPIFAVTADTDATLNFDMSICSGILLKPVTSAKVFNALKKMLQLR